VQVCDPFGLLSVQDVEREQGSYGRGRPGKVMECLNGLFKVLEKSLKNVFTPKLLEKS